MYEYARENNILFYIEVISTILEGYKVFFGHYIIFPIELW